MKKLFLIFAALFLAGSVFAQSEPVSWSFTAKKVSGKTYDVYMTATLKSGWHIYSQTQPKDAIALPTKVVFANNPLTTLVGDVKEVGKMQKVKDAALGSTAHQFSNTVNFVQRVTLKSDAKTNINGTIEYQLCDDKMCLPPKKLPVKVSVG